MDDDLLADLVATDLRRNLEARAPNVRDVYGVCLWSDDLYGTFLVSLATEAEFERQRRFPAYASQPDEILFAPGGMRWSVGNWHKFPDDEFVTEETEAALEPIVSRMRDDTLTFAEIEAGSARWQELTFAAFELAQPLDLLPCTEDAIAFVAIDEMNVEEQLELMSRTVPASRMQPIFPQWRRPGD
jgi:hypothetical protein